MAGADEVVRQRNIPKKDTANIENDKGKNLKSDKQPKSKNNKQSAQEQAQEVQRQLFDNLNRPSLLRRNKLWVRPLCIMTLMGFIYFYSKYKENNKYFAMEKHTISMKMKDFECSKSYEREMKFFPKCVPNKCGRIVTDQLVDPIEIDMLLDLVYKMFASGGSSGGASILDLHSGALSFEEKFVNVYNISKLSKKMNDKHFQVYNLIKRRIHETIAKQFGIPASSLYLTYPTFFSKITNATAKTVHDQYWHIHVDKMSYESFHYTSLVYLNTYKDDYLGGRFIFVDGGNDNRTTLIVEPKKGRVLAFTSGEENRHFVERVQTGTRYALTISFTFNRKYAIYDPNLKTKKKSTK